MLVEDWRGRLISNPAYYQATKTMNTRKVLNGESFNYANRNNRTHELLDSSPPGDLIINYENSQKVG